MLRKGRLDVPPEELQGQDIDIEYVSPLAKAQKLTDLQSMMRGLEVLLQLGQSLPVMDYIDDDGLVKYLVDVAGMPAKVIKSNEEVAALREQQAQQQAQLAQQQQEMMNAEQAQKTAPLLKVLSEAEQAEAPPAA